ncbi:hypothetical protein [Crocinitomix catalasitica]|uniref:hypothetical protein n=1 Tax=Crocinitomix catalasitica TaxID=184607 RepID=UPI00055FFB20|nr:hypothetical protein [Crocinitomix catalasitica]
MNHFKLHLLNSKHFLAVMLIIFLGCRKDAKIELKDEIIIENDCGFACNDIPPSTSPFGYSTIFTGPQYLTPKYNPANDQEFIYVRKSESEGTELVKVNLIDMSETVLLSSVYVRSEPVWNSEGWIVFSALNNKIWKIKDDGTDFTQLTFGRWDIFPYFNFDGAIIYYHRKVMYSNPEFEANPELYKDSKIIGISLNGAPVDSILAPDIRNKPDQPFLYQKWHQADFADNLVYFSWGDGVEYDGIYTFNLLNNEILPVHIWNLKKDNLQLVKNVKYYDGFIYLSKFLNDLLKINVQTGESTRIKCGCDENYYNTLSISPSGDKILVERIITTVINGGELDEQHEIWMMDLDGSNAVKILGDPE